MFLRCSLCLVHSIACFVEEMKRKIHLSHRYSCYVWFNVSLSTLVVVFHTILVFGLISCYRLSSMSLYTSAYGFIFQGYVASFLGFICCLWCFFLVFAFNSRYSLDFGVLVYELCLKMPFSGILFAALY